MNTHTHGTRRGYNRHLAEGSRTCPDCRLANTNHVREQRRRNPRTVPYRTPTAPIESRSIRATVDLWDRVDVLAEEEGVTPAEYVSRVIETHLIL